MSDATFWDKIATSYAAQPVKDPAAFARKKAITREHLRASSTVLEIGCGTGSLALEMSAWAGHIHALDHSSEMLRIANERKDAKQITNVTFRQGRLERALPYEPASFDNVWAYSILHLIPDRARTLANVYDLLQPGGTFISSNACLGDSWVPFGPMIAVMRWLGKAPMVHIYDRATIMRELHDAGFVDIVEHDVGADSTIAFLVARKPATLAAPATAPDR